MKFIEKYLQDAQEIIRRLDKTSIEKTINLISAARERQGRMFILGVGGGAGHAGHAVCDFRKTVQIEAYTPTDNVSELTARINDEGWDTCYANWLKASNLREGDIVCVFSVGGGNAEYNLSVNIIKALELARERGAAITGIVGRDGGETAKLADACIIIPQVSPEMTTAQTESFQALVWHLIISHPKLCAAKMRWESANESQEGAK